MLQWACLRLPIAAFVVGLALAATARAQDGAEYRALIAEAVGEFDAQRFAEARALFERAHALSPTARTLRGIGLTSFELRDYATTYRSLTAALAETRNPLTASQSEEARSLLVRAARFLAVYRLTDVSEGLTMRLDGGAIATSDGRILVPLGTHALALSAPGRRDRTLDLTVSGGEDTELSVALESAGAPSTPRDVTSDLAAPGSDGEGGGVPPDGEIPVPARAGDPLPGIALVIAGSALAGGALVTGLGWWLAQVDEASRCAAAGAACDNAGAIASARDAAAGTTVALASLGAAGLVVGGILVAGSSGGSSAAAALPCAPAALGVVCRGSF